MTLIELLAVLAIVGMLASLLLPAVGRSRIKAQVQRAHVEMDQIVSAINEYHSLYGRFPVSDEAVKAAALFDEDVTYGGVIEGTQIWIAAPTTYRTNNCEVTAVLLDLEQYGDGAPTINQGHVKNPRRSPFLSALMAGGTNAAPGIGIDGIYRDPWGAPYVITMDLNGDGRARDFLYHQPTVSLDPSDPSRGLNGLVRGMDLQHDAVFEVPAPAVAWSAGPDHKLSTFEKANQGFNRDNIVSWKR